MADAQGLPDHFFVVVDRGCIEAKGVERGCHYAVVPANLDRVQRTGVNNG